MNMRLASGFLQNCLCHNCHVISDVMKPLRLGCLMLAWLGMACAQGFGSETATASAGPTNTFEPGHSLHGEAFNEGPRQSAKLLAGTGKVKIKITSRHAEAQAFFNQGVGQLHGFWYFEAERSFRQVAAFDTNCAMAYWGMAMANVNNSNRAAGFIQRAYDLKRKAGPREVRWIDAYHAYFTGKESDTDRRKDLLNALENIVEKY